MFEEIWKGLGQILRGGEVEVYSWYLLSKVYQGESYIYISKVSRIAFQMLDLIVQRMKG